MKRLLVNDALTQIPGTRTLWNELQDWFDMEFIGHPFNELSSKVDLSILAMAFKPSLIIRNATWFNTLASSQTIPTISLLQDIMEDGPLREMQEAVIKSSKMTVFNSEFTSSKYEDVTLIKAHHHASTGCALTAHAHTIIPLPVDFSIFEPGNPMGLQQALSLPDGCVCWIGSQHPVKGWDIFLSVARHNPDIPFVAVFKDALPEYLPPNVRAFVRLPQDELVKVIGACRVGLCTSRIESQHLAGIEMGACGLPMVAPPVGTYYERKDMPGEVIDEPTPSNYSETLRAWLFPPPGNHLLRPPEPSTIREYWKREFDRSIIRATWTKLIEEVECSGRS